MPVVNPPAAQGAGVEPCVWPADTSCCPDWTSYEPAIQARAVAWATEILYAMSGRQFGTCNITVRPCGGGCDRNGWMTWPVFMDGNVSGNFWMQPFIGAGGVWRNCVCGSVCKCRPTHEVWLPGPIASIESVTVDGIVLDPSAYRVDNQHSLVRIDGEPWPECQDMDADEAAENTFFVIYQRGRAVPVGGQIAAGILACEFAKSCTSGCQLPGNLSSLSRQGVEVQIVDPTDVLQNGLTGLHDVDLWLRAVNPYRRPARSRVYSPDLNYPRQTA